MESRSIKSQVSHVLQNIFGTAVVFLYPTQCRVCCQKFLEGIPSAYICADCWRDDIQFLEPPWCDICGTPNPHIKGLCDECAISPPRYGKLRSIAFYQDTVRRAIHLFKFEQKKVLAPHLVRLINTHLPTDCCFADYDFILPVPIHKKRLRERGFNQAEILAKGISQAKRVPLCTDTLVRHQHTVAQSSLGWEDRQRNIAGVFSVSDPKKKIPNKRLLIVDDVFTTGATVHEAVNELWKVNPAEVDVLTLARTSNTASL